MARSFSRSQIPYKDRKDCNMRDPIILRTQRKGSLIMIEETELRNYMDAKLRDFTGWLTNGILALIMISLIVVLTFFQAPDLAFLALILIPLAARHYMSRVVSDKLTDHFKELAKP